MIFSRFRDLFFHLKLSILFLVERRMGFVMKQFTLMCPDLDPKNDMINCWFSIDLLPTGVNTQQFFEYVLGHVCWIIYKE